MNEGSRASTSRPLEGRRGPKIDQLIKFPAVLAFGCPCDPGGRWMGDGMLKEGIAPARLSAEQYAQNFADLHPPLTRHEAFVEADRCYFCFDAPCQTACP